FCFYCRTVLLRFLLPLSVHKVCLFFYFSSLCCSSLKVTACILFRAYLFFAIILFFFPFYTWVSCIPVTRTLAKKKKNNVQLVHSTSRGKKERWERERERERVWGGWKV